ncbi:MAG: hypothetical protein AAF378_22735 [Cyanobacteria bacterium P01_A01_bin.84]
MVQQDNLKLDIALSFEESRFTINESKLQDMQNMAVVSSTSFASSRGNRLDCDGRLSPTRDESSVYIKTEDRSSSYLNYISIKLDNLRCFETVERQYKNEGVIFNNTIAIEPSNPAFPTLVHRFVLMGSPKSGFMEASFIKPVKSVCAYVTSSQRLEFCAYNRDRQLIGKAILPGANLANSGSSLDPSSLLSINGDDIHDVTFSAFDGQFIIDGFSYCY